MSTEIRDFGRNLRITVCAAALLALSPSVASAQSSGGAIEEIIVTAQKRDQNLRDVPISISAFSEEDLDDRNIESPLDIAHKTPGLVGSIQAAVPSFNIRGIGTNDFGVGADPAVGIYLDGVYIARTVSSIVGLYDVERVEVIKGPQGTLFGRSAAAGAISIVSKKPNENFEGKIRGEIGNMDSARMLASVNFPLSDAAFLRLSGLSNRRDGYVRNTLNDTDLNNVDEYGGRIAFRFLPSDTLDVTLSADLINSESNGVGLKSATIPFPGDDGSPYGDVAHDILHPYSNVENKGIAMHVTWDANPNMSLTSITSYRQYVFDLLEDDDGSFVTLLATGSAPEESKMFSQELRLNGQSNDQVTWFLGASYFHEDVSTNGIAQSDMDVLFGPASGGPFEEQSFSNGDYESFAVYGDVTYAFNDRLDIIAGVRWSRDEKDFNLYVPANPGIGFNVLFGGVDPKVFLSDSWDSFQPRFVLQYDATDNVMTYISAARGYKPGGFGSFELQPPFDPEFVWSYEAGVKAITADGDAQINAAIFYYDYADLQVTTQVGLALQTTNASEASGKGFEVDATWYPSPDFKIRGSVAYLDAKYDKFIQGELDPFTFLPVSFDRSGNRLSRAPELQFNVGVEYRHEIADAGATIMSAEYAYQSETFFHASNDDFRSQDGYGLLSMRIMYQPNDGNWSLSLTGENLLDEEYLVDAGGLAAALLSPTTLRGLPRTYGLELSVRF